MAKRSILMFPWLAHGHISPFIELAKKLTQKNFEISLISTPINLKPFRENQEMLNSISINLIDLHLPPMEELPPHLHTTKNLPPHLMSTLKTALDLAKPEFYGILESLKPDVVIYDYLQTWAYDVAKEQGIEAVVFITAGAAAISFLAHYSLKKDGGKFPFEEIEFPESQRLEMMEFMNDSANGKTNEERFFESCKKSSDFVLMKTSREIEGKYVDYLSLLLEKEIVPVGPLVHEPESNDEDAKMVMNWLDEKEEGSVVYVSFGSECFLGKEEIEEIAYGLEESKVGFVWVVRFLGGEGSSGGGPISAVHEVLPEGFLRRVGEKGMVLEGWAPQVRILSHGSVGGFVSHCGFNSTLEAIVFGVPIVAMPMQLDQPFNAKLVGGIGVGMEVKKEEGRFKREDIARVIKEVVIAKEGEGIRVRAKELGEKMRGKGDDEIDFVAKKLLDLVKD